MSILGNHKNVETHYHVFSFKGQYSNFTVAQGITAIRVYGIYFWLGCLLSQVPRIAPKIIALLSIPHINQSSLQQLTIYKERYFMSFFYISFFIFHYFYYFLQLFYAVFPLLYLLSCEIYLCFVIHC